MDKQHVFRWSLYDFGNYISSIVVVLYFSQWLIIDHGVADLWYNLIFVCTHYRSDDLGDPFWLPQSVIKGQVPRTEEVRRSQRRLYKVLRSWAASLWH